ncbi:outer membrane protein assembly factor BamB [Thiocystis minor]|uniref:outer membrane protein assembly factor BamB n=1 Tax=Thiocystis minor TaxID=61597 RepID=UPI00191238B4|nr:outer membrane protein assembly factor BamB [Thiocystis minor]MBK5965117.1 outer membrane protein assembly factor BamB [Thiocystis minor]
MGFQCRSTLTRLGAVLLAALLAGCGSIPWFGKDKDPTPPTKLSSVVQEVAVNVLWSARPTRGSDGRRLYLVPALAASHLYVADARGRVVSIAAETGRILWERETGLTFSGGPDVEGDRLALGTSQGELLVLSTQDGREQWRALLGSEVLSVPRFTGDGKLVVHTLDDTLYGLDAATGKELWRIAYPAPVLTLRGSSTPTMTPSGIVVGLSGGKLIKLDPQDGTPLWEVIVSRPSGRSELARIADIDADPILIGNTLYVGSYNGDLAAVDATTGEVLWRRELSAHAGLAAEGTGLFVTDSQDRIWAADLDSGAGRWKQENLLYRQLTAPALVGNLLAVGDLEGYLHLLNQSDGRLVGRTRISKKGGITARPLVSGGRLYVYAKDGTLAALTVGASSVSKGRDKGADATQTAVPVDKPVASSDEAP